MKKKKVRILSRLSVEVNGENVSFHALSPSPLSADSHYFKGVFLLFRLAPAVSALSLSLSYPVHYVKHKVLYLPP